MINPTLEGWLLVISNGYSFLGRPETPLNQHLSPVYTLVSMIGPDLENPHKQGVVHMVQPVHLLTSLQRLEIPTGAIIISMSDVSIEERKHLAKFVGIAEKIIAKLRIESTGLTIL